MGKVLRLNEHWDAAKNEYWVGLELLAVPTCPPSEKILLGPPCRTFEEVKDLASDIRADLDKLLVEAQVRIAYHNLGTTLDADLKPVVSTPSVGHCQS